MNILIEADGFQEAHEWCYATTGTGYFACVFYKDPNALIRFGHKYWQVLREFDGFAEHHFGFFGVSHPNGPPLTPTVIKNLEQGRRRQVVVIAGLKLAHEKLHIFQIIREEIVWRQNKGLDTLLLIHDNKAESFALLDAQWERPL